MTNSTFPTYYSPFQNQEEPCGYCIQGFFEEFDLSRDGKLSYEEDFLPHFKTFIESFRAPLPPFENFINSYRHYLGLSYLFAQNPWQGAVIEGFRFDFDLHYDPCFLAIDDLDVETHDRLCCLALNAFFRSLDWEGLLSPEILAKKWHQFITISAVCYQKTALSGEYASLKLPSYEDAFKEEGSGAFKPALLQFCALQIKKHGYFLPSHFYNKWLEHLRS